MKFIFVTWGVISGLGKGITAASIGKLLKLAGHKVNLIKLDPYLNVDAGTMSPYRHGEVFVTDDGFETDLDLGHYERFLNQNLSKNSSITTGQIYQKIISKERNGDYLGRDVQVIPHVTDEIKETIQKHAKHFDVTIVEIGWTIGDIEAPHFIEAIRQMKQDLGKKNVCYVHVAPIIYLPYSGEMKTKQIQHSVKELTHLWIIPDFLVCRSSHPLTKDIKEKLALYCDLKPQEVIEARDAESIYQVPQQLKQQDFDLLIQKRLGLKVRKAELKKRNQSVNDFLHPKKSINVGIVWKYAELHDSYLSVIEALKHAGAAHKTQIKLHWIQAEQFEDTKERIKVMKSIDGLVIPGGFGKRWMDGKIKAAQYCREKNIPYLGLCLWLQMAVVEYARNVCGLKRADTVEADPASSTPVISRMPGQSEELRKGGSMRLWTYTTKLQKWTLVRKLYGKDKTTERHRHRFEVNPDYYDLLEKNWMILSWRDIKSHLVEFIELPKHRFFVWTQAHPEFKSRLDDPHPLFLWFVKACWEKK